MKLEIVADITDPGKPGGASDDRYGWNANAVFVIDGATGIGDREVMAEGDAAWLAGHAARMFAAAEDRAVAETVAEINASARDIYYAAAETDDLPRYMWPAAAFQMLRIEDDHLVTYGLGDCRLFLQDAVSGNVFETSALKGNRDLEIAAAHAHLARIGGFKGAADISGDAETLAMLRAGRARHNTPDGRVFTLGLVPEAADRIVREATGIMAPARGLLCSDGFAALVDNYDAFSPESLIEAAFSDGLPALLEILRQIEREQDPDGEKYPRYKVSDDAAAVAFRVL
ncbi:hypothetical protein [Martelella endophytica]|uniref:Serine/threonine protein phosphatase n=1 Tax=Martelella endophytica TaxID=1486262 RepID=A0A0D5LL40_MAREN|nr:hypothetical protein [Martelella endophytica]AJY44487.1 hypothetical protein TM49_00395 [Martelella endophytica]